MASCALLWQWKSIKLLALHIRVVVRFFRNRAFIFEVVPPLIRAVHKSAVDVLIALFYNES